MDLDGIDLMEPRAFEDWVLAQLRVAGYDIARTPVTGDGGVDGIAIATDNRPPLLVQCKHTQRNALAHARGVRDVLRGRERYDLDGTPELMVVTNAMGFTDSARALAAREGVVLVDRGLLSLLRSWRCERSP